MIITILIISVLMIEEAYHSHNQMQLIIINHMCSQDLPWMERAAEIGW